MEVMLAVLLISAAIVPMMRLGPGIVKTKRGSEEGTRSTFLATRMMEEVRARALYNYPSDFTQAATSFTAEHDDYRYSITDTGPGSNLRTIAVSAWHKDAPANPVILHTKIARRLTAWHPTNRVANYGIPQDYSYFNAALNDAALAGGHDVRAKEDAALYIEDVTVPATVPVGAAIKVTGGYNNNFSGFMPNGYSTIKGDVKIYGGRFQLKNIRIE